MNCSSRNPGRPIVSLALGLSLIITITGCGEKVEPTPEVSNPEMAIAERALSARLAAEPINWLAEEFPDLSREAGFRIQKIAMDKQLAEGLERRGWKMGGTYMADLSASPDPLYGYSLSSHFFTSDVPVPPAQFVGQAPLIEAEVAIWIAKDLPGPTVTMDEFRAAVAGVGGAIEIVSPRLPSDGGTPSVPHLLADNVAHAGTLVGDVRVSIDDFEFDQEEAVAKVEGEERARGISKNIMGSAGTPLDAAFWLANELPKHGLYLKAGEFILTGSLYVNPTLLPGQTAEVSFSSLGSLSVTLADQ